MQGHEEYRLLPKKTKWFLYFLLCLIHVCKPPVCEEQTQWERIPMKKLQRIVLGVFPIFHSKVIFSMTGFTTQNKHCRHHLSLASSFIFYLLVVLLLLLLLGQRWVSQCNSDLSCVHQQTYKCCRSKNISFLTTRAMRS